MNLIPKMQGQKRVVPSLCQEAKFPCDVPVSSWQAAELFQKLLRKGKHEQEERAET